jgi:hypothetical protein
VKPPPSRRKDMKFLLEQLAVLNASDPIFGGRLDLDRIGLYGGAVGQMTVQTCSNEMRLKCAVLGRISTRQSFGV